MALQHPYSSHGSLVFTLALLSFTWACGSNSTDVPLTQAGPQATSTSDGTPLRVVAANLTSGTRQNYEAGHGQRILQALHADVVLIQEFHYGDNRRDTIQNWVEETFGAEFSYMRDNATVLPNGVISRWPIMQSGVWRDPYVYNRDFSWARIDVPGERDLWAVSVHLLTRSAGERAREARVLIDEIKKQVPDEDYLVIGGDLNTSARGESAIVALREVVEAHAPYPVDQRGDGDTSANRTQPYDWVLADRDLDDLSIATSIGNHSFASGLVVDTRVYDPITDLSPALRSDSDAFNMQHMAVLRDFLLPPERVEPVEPIEEEEEPDPSLMPIVLINEVLANEPGSDTAQEFVEIVNIGSSYADLSSWTLSDAASLRHRFSAPTRLQPNAAIVVFGGANAVQADLPSSICASTGSLGLSNSGDTVVLANAQGEIVTRVEVVRSADGVSLNRALDLDPLSSFLPHDQLCSATSSPGTRIDGSAF